MNHQGTQSLLTERLILRPFTLHDVASAYENWMNDPEVTEFLRWPAHKDAGVTHDVLSGWVSDYGKDDFYQWAIVLKDTNVPIGSISVVSIVEKTATVQVGFCIGRPWWNQGYTSEAFRSVIALMFDRVGARRVEAQHDPNNPGSGRVMEKAGLTFEGTLRQADWNTQGVVDACIYSLIYADYEK